MEYLGKYRAVLSEFNNPPNALSHAAAASNQLRPVKVNPSLPCAAELHIGIFFDGTGNNKEIDYGSENKPLPFLLRKHTNVVRLYNAFPDELSLYRKREKKESGDLNQFRRIYVPGVGTDFPEIQEIYSNDDKSSVMYDEKTAQKKTMLTPVFGLGLGAGGEARILWAMIQVLNMVHEFYAGIGEKRFSDKDAFAKIQKMVCETEKVQESKERRIFYKPASKTASFYNLVYTDNRLRRAVFKELRESITIPVNPRPHLQAIHIYAFGFSRGAAEARVFVNWLSEFGWAVPRPAGESTSGWLDLANAGIRMTFPFLGIFDTVASVGVPGMYSLFEGHSGWAHKTLQIPPLIQKCVHLVAAHEIRATFPLDTVRVDEEYPGNCEETVFPGAHSDIGGGYSFEALGKKDLIIQAPRTSNGEQSSQVHPLLQNTAIQSLNRIPSERCEDLQLSRIPGLHMYLRAMENSVPFYTLHQLREQEREEIAKDLLPSQKTIDRMREYLAFAKIPVAPVEEMIRQHTSLYLHWRWKQGYHYAYPNKDTDCEVNRPLLKENELEGLRRTQKELMSVIATYCHEMDRRMLRMMDDHLINGGPDERNIPLDNTNSILYKTAEFLAGQAIDLTLGKVKYIGKMGVALTRAVKSNKMLTEQMIKDAEDLKRFSNNCETAKEVLDILEDWRAMLRLYTYGEAHDTEAPEREAMWLFNGLTFGEKHSDREQKFIGEFFSNHVHDSMAGFDIKEFSINGYGIGKFRRLFFGNDGDDCIVNQVKILNGKNRVKKPQWKPTQNSERALREKIYMRMKRNEERKRGNST